MSQPEMQWLRAYAATGSQEAFGALSRQYVNLVYAAARRQVGDAHLAEDITQAVFIVLAQKAKSVPTDRPLSAWLMKVTRYCAANARRTKLHRETHERRAAEMARDETVHDQVDDYEEMAPLLDEGLSKLRPADRDALLLKYFEQKSLREVGEALGVSEEAAQKRVTRAVDRLRDFFRRRGSTVSAVTLTVLLTSESSKAAPAGLAASVGTTAAGGSTAAATMAKGAMVAMATQKTTAMVIGGLVLLLGIGGGAVAVHSMNKTSRTVDLTTPGSSSAHLVDLAAGPANGVVTFADGTRVECTAMSEVNFNKAKGLLSDLIGTPNTPTSERIWWKADGSPTAAPDLGGDVVYLPEKPGHRGIRLVFESTGPSSNVTIRIPNVQGYASSVRSMGNIRRTNMAVSFPDTTDTIDIRVGMTKGAWRTDISTPVTTTSAGTSAPSTQPTRVQYGKITDGALDSDGNQVGAGCTVELLRDSINVGDRERVMRAITTDGKEITYDSAHGDGRRTLYHFSCTKDKLAKLVWQSRPYEWATMTGISVKPIASGTTEPATK